jgi:hypothetical protein
MNRATTILGHAHRVVFAVPCKEHQQLMHSFFLIMKYQGGLGGKVEEDIGVDAEKEDTDNGDDQGNF